MPPKMLPKSDTNRSATIGRLNPSGIATHVWSTQDYGGKSGDVMMATAIREGKLKDTGMYIVCWINADGIPFGRAYTVQTTLKGELEVKGGVRADRVTRWPPRA